MAKNQKADAGNNNGQNLSNNNPIYKANQDNRADQLNPNNAKYQGKKK